MTAKELPWPLRKKSPHDFFLQVVHISFSLSFGIQDTVHGFWLLSYARNDPASLCEQHLAVLVRSPITTGQTKGKWEEEESTMGFGGHQPFHFHLANVGF